MNDWTYQIVTQPTAEMYEWLYLNCHKSWFTAGMHGNMYSEDRRIVFRHPEDLLLFKLRFSSEL